jgi:RimJ/RimL family protein N-acetyltransferase
MIRRVEKNELESVAKYAYQLNSDPQHKCKAFPTDYVYIAKQFKQIISHPNDELLILTDENTLCGVLALCVEPEDKYLEALGGVFAHNNYEAAAKEFYEYLKSNYSGYKFDAAYPEENQQAIEFMKSIGAKLEGNDYELRIGKNKYKSLPESANIIELNEKYYRGFVEIHDRFHPNAYWTGQRLLKALDRFDIFIVIENDEVIGSIVTSNSTRKVEEFYLIEVAENKQNQGYGTALINQALNHAFHNGTDELMVMVDKNNEAALHVYEKLGFKKTDTCLTFSNKLG